MYALILTHFPHLPKTYIYRYKNDRDESTLPMLHTLGHLFKRLHIKYQEVFREDTGGCECPSSSK